MMYPVEAASGKSRGGCSAGPVPGIYLGRERIATTTLDLRLGVDRAVDRPVVRFPVRERL